LNIASPGVKILFHTPRAYFRDFSPKDTRASMFQRSIRVAHELTRPQYVANVSSDSHGIVWSEILHVGPELPRRGNADSEPKLRQSFLNAMLLNT